MHRRIYTFHCIVKGVFWIRLGDVGTGCMPEMMVGSVNNSITTLNGKNENNVIEFPGLARKAA